MLEHKVGQHHLEHSLRVTLATFHPRLRPPAGSQSLTSSGTTAQSSPRLTPTSAFGSCPIEHERDSTQSSAASSGFSADKAHDAKHVVYCICQWAFLKNFAEQIPLTTNTCCRWQIGLRSRHKQTVTRRRRCIMQSACGRDGAKENWRAHHLLRTHHKRSFFATGSWALGKASKTSKMALVHQDS